MPVDYRIDRMEQVVHMKAWGVVTAEEVLEARTRLAVDPIFTFHMHQILDARGIERFDITETDLEILAQWDPFHPDARRAFVAPQGAIHSTLGSYAVQMTSPETCVRAFSDMSEARAWLGLSPRSHEIVWD
jgi:hypothetical protein